MPWPGTGATRMGRPEVYWVCNKQDTDPAWQSRHGKGGVVALWAGTMRGGDAAHDGPGKLSEIRGSATQAKSCYGQRKRGATSFLRPITRENVPEAETQHVFVLESHLQGMTMGQQVKSGSDSALLMLIIPSEIGLKAMASIALSYDLEAYGPMKRSEQRKQVFKSELPAAQYPRWYYGLLARPET
ncbi:hypothetical protein K438DRAFT_1775602 [Mycena galopus ATCC 62051]|nr:hypothetical protein K438DRAFT_1775602 [Mycena galopus ATCC 62051]